ATSLWPFASPVRSPAACGYPLRGLTGVVKILVKANLLWSCGYVEACSQISIAVLPHAAGIPMNGLVDHS
ncbi:MAG: hypothetical protein OXE57_01490, partial [Alphaproteobacteria bacterium]|nr:hypothetical protein [Alphaproteobacteria bacterium]